MCLLYTVLFLSICPLLTQSQEIKNVAVSSDVTFGRCEPNKVFKLQHDGVTAHIPCNTTARALIPQRFQGRLIVDKTNGSIILQNVTKSDAGYYTLERNNGHGEKEPTTRVELQVLDLVWIHELVHNVTDRTISLTLGPDEDMGTINWKIDEDLLVPHWRSPDSRTLTIAYNHSDVITVKVSNLVSADRKLITLLKDPNGNSSHLDYIMYRNMTKLIWDKDGGHTDNWRRSLPRNISNIGVQIPSDEVNGPPSRSHFFFLALIVIAVMLCFIIPMAVLLFSLQCKKGDKCQKRTAQVRHEDENQQNEMVDMHKANGFLKNGSEAAIPFKDPEKPSIDKTTGDDASANDVDHLEQTIRTECSVLMYD